MQKFRKFLDSIYSESDSDLFHLDKTKIGQERDNLIYPPTRVTPSGNDEGFSELKDKNIKTAELILRAEPQITLKELSGRSEELTDMLDFARRHDFDESMPLFVLIDVYRKIRRK